MQLTPVEITTRHGENIAEQIKEPDAYGYFNTLTVGDVWNILDNLHTHFMDQGIDYMLPILTRWMNELEGLDID